MKKRQNRICMVTYSDYEFDVRVRREAESLIDEGYEVDVICLPSENHKKNYSIKKVNVYPITKFKFFSHRDKAIKFLYRYLIFGINLSFKATILKIKRKFNVLHIHNPPDPFVFFVLHIKIFSRVKIILDRHEPLYLGVQTLFENKTNKFIIAAIKLIEKWSFKVSNKIILINQIEYDDLLKRDIRKDKLHIVTNTIDESRIIAKYKVSCKDLLPKTHNYEKKKYLIYQGLISKERDLDTLVKAVKLIREEKKHEDFHLIVCGEGSFSRELEIMIEENSLSDFFTITGKIPFEELVGYINCADIGLVLAKKNDFYQRYSPNKIFEYYYFNKLTIVSRLDNLQKVALDSCIYYNSDNPIELANKISLILKNFNEIYESKKEIIRSIYSKNSWKIVKKELFLCYTQLLKDKKRYIKKKENEV